MGNISSSERQTACSPRALLLTKAPVHHLLLHNSLMLNPAPAAWSHIPPLFVRGITEKNRRTIFMKVGTDELDVEFQSLRRKTVRGCGNLCGRHRLADVQRCWLNFSTLNKTVRGRVPAILPSKCGLVATLRPG